MRRLLIALTCLAVTHGTLADATETAVAPTVDYASLPPLGAAWLAANPYRGREEAPLIGRAAYNQACARCHGADASTNAAPAPDLRNLDRACRRIADAAIKAKCMADNDAWFAKSVRGGKIIVGVTHMPPWDGVLPQELAWAIQTFIESHVGAPK
ncbi:c-type cytochrome [Dechloromonas sp. H13]|uniref:c-type cytochrome n=1 Tax=Dechloromonas sp. H13 TaxID=2570193 RepID=UPI0012921A3F|nr:c-type cytochrome [Dechloromonas sp. H13]